MLSVQSFFMYADAFNDFLRGDRFWDCQWLPYVGHNAISDAYRASPEALSAQEHYVQCMYLRMYGQVHSEEAQAHIEDGAHCSI